jgi:hypothetical protein
VKPTHKKDYKPFDILKVLVKLYTYPKAPEAYFFFLNTNSLEFTINSNTLETRHKWRKTLPILAVYSVINRHQ